jgi:hypothetical protein
LHDTIEDTETTLEELQQEFGTRIAGILYLFFEEFMYNARYCC